MLGVVVGVGLTVVTVAAVIASGGTLLVPILVGAGVGDYLKIARVDGAGFLSRSAVALLSKLYTMGPTIVTGVGRGVTKFVGNYIGD